MAQRTSPERDAIAFAERVLALLDQGTFVATYKYAVLLALIDLCLEGTGHSGSAPEMVTTGQLAEKVLELYWHHTLPFQGQRKGRILRQNAGRQARIIRDIERFRAKLSDPSLPMRRAQRERPRVFQELIWDIEWTLILMPLPRLQIIGQQEDRIIYDIDWDTRIEGKRRLVSEYQRKGTGPFDNRILLRPRVAEYLVILNSLLRPLIQRNWTSMVAQMNGIEESKLEEFLFGSDRVAMNLLKPGLRELQQSRCFYCREEIMAHGEIDHFIPWSRYPDNGIENLVLAHDRCNRDKRDFLAASEHVRHWADRNKEGSQSGAYLHEIASRNQWETHRAQTLGAAL